MLGETSAISVASYGYTIRIGADWKMKKGFLLGALLFSAGVLLSACGSPSTGSDANPPKKTQEPAQQPPVSQTPPSVNRDEIPDASKVEVEVYRGSRDGTAVVKEKAVIPKMASVEKKVMVLFNLLKESGQNTAPSVPLKVQLSGAKIENGVMTLDLSQDVQSMSSTEERLFVEAVPQTMFANFADVNKVMFTIGGQPADALSQSDVSKGIPRQ
jgi:hypothetical protein